MSNRKWAAKIEGQRPGGRDWQDAPTILKLAFARCLEDAEFNADRTQRSAATLAKQCAAVKEASKLK